MITSIAIDATHFSSSQPTGVEEYTRYLLPQLSRLLADSGVAVTWISHAEQRAPETPPRTNWVVSSHAPQWSQTALPRLLRILKPDLYFTPSGIPPLFYGGKTASTVHDLGVYEFPDSYSFEQLVLLRFLARRVARKSAAILTPSAYCKGQIESRWGIAAGKITVTPEAFQKTKVTSEPLEHVGSDPFLAFIGRIETKKNLLPVIEGFARLSAQIVTQLVLAGKDGHGAKEVYAAIAKLPAHIRSRIVMPGYVSAGQKQWLFEHAAAIIMPGRAEGFGIPVLEAFAYKVPVLCAQAGSLPEVAGDAAVYVQADIPTDWSLQMAALLTDTKLASQLARRGETQLKKFDWKTTARLSADALLAC
jgi:glycosyltransferase involved in cell wall biosynthesis